MVGPLDLRQQPLGGIGLAIQHGHRQAGQTSMVVRTEDDLRQLLIGRVFAHVLGHVSLQCKI